jgi:sulfate adenylyltransferase large subunit
MSSVNSAQVVAAPPDGAAVEATLRAEEEKDLLRFVTVGSVDDGKSTLIGRLLYDLGALYEDQLAAIRRASQKSGGVLDLSLVTDGLLAEREQGITIDVAYRYFSTARRKIILCDTPGHVQYTRNMATGASTADLAIILIDARLGVLPQSRRHAFIASLLGIPRLVVAVNKMDLVGWEAARFHALRDGLARVVAKLSFREVIFLPVSALHGGNVTTRAAEAPWFDGPTLLDVLETAPAREPPADIGFRFPVQHVIRPEDGKRFLAGTIAAGSVGAGDEVALLPSGRRSRVAEVRGPDGPLDEKSRAVAGMAISVRLGEEVDVSRGEMLASPERPPRVARELRADMVWLHERPLDPGRSYLVKHTTQTVRADVVAVEHRVDLETLSEVPAASLEVNDIGRVVLRAHRPLFVDPYAKSRVTGAFILIDSVTNDTVAAGMIAAHADDDRLAVGGAAPPGQRTQVSTRERAERLGHAPGLIAIAPGPRALAFAFAVERALFDAGRVAAVAETPALARALAAAGLVAVVVTSETIDGARTVSPPPDGDDDDDTAARRLAASL